MEGRSLELAHSIQPQDLPGSGQRQRPEMRTDSLSGLDLLEEPSWSVRPPEATLVWSTLLPQAMIRPEIHLDSGPCCCEEVGSEEGVRVDDIAVSGYTDIRACAATRDHGDVCLHATAKGHVWVCGPINARVCDDNHGLFYHQSPCRCPWSVLLPC